MWGVVCVSWDWIFFKQWIAMRQYTVLTGWQISTYLANSSSIAGGEKRRYPTGMNSSPVLDCDIPVAYFLRGWGFIG